MPHPVSPFVLRARQLEIDGLHHLAVRVDLAGVVGELIHALQHERGATSLYLASGGQRFATERQTAAAATVPIEARLGDLCQAQLDPAQGASAPMMSLLAWVSLDLQGLRALRHLADLNQVSAHDVVAGFSRVIAGLVELVFHLADAAAEPAISRLLVAFVHLVQGKEAAGQERALGAQLFASGRCDDDEQQRIVHLIDAQEHSLQVFADFADGELATRWAQHQLTPKVAQLERLRRTLCAAKAGAPLDTALSESWFELTSERITELWQLEEALVQCLRQACAARIASSQQALLDSEGLLEQLRQNPPPHANAVGRFFDNAAGQPAAAPVLGTDGARPAPVPAAAAPAADLATVASLQAMLQAQQSRLAAMEAELDAAKRTLNERKVIERAKGALMSRLGLSEEAAYRALQKAAMDHNKRLVDMAEAALALPDMAYAVRR